MSLQFLPWPVKVNRAVFMESRYCLKYFPLSVGLCEFFFVLEIKKRRKKEKRTRTITK